MNATVAKGVKYGKRTGQTDTQRGQDDNTQTAGDCWKPGHRRDCDGKIQFDASKSETISHYAKVDC
jgi:hypothetical protein